MVVEQSLRSLASPRYMDKYDLGDSTTRLLIGFGQGIKGLEEVMRQ